MTVEYVEGFEAAYTTASMQARGYTVAGATFATAVTGRNALGSALNANTGGGGWEITIPLPGGNKASRVIGIALRQNNYDGNWSLLDLMNGSQDVTNFDRDGSGNLRVRRGGTVLGTTPSPVWSSTALGIWHFVEWVTTINSTTGRHELWVDGTKLIDFTGNTQNGSSAFASALRLSGYGGNQMYFDDLYIGDTRLGDRRVVTNVITADSAVAWTPSSGANYSTVDELPASATDYNAATAAGLRDQFVLADMPATPVSIDAVQVSVCALRMDSGPRTIRAGLVSGAATGLGTAATPPLTPTSQNMAAIFQVDPNTSAAWTLAGVNAIEPFYESVT